MFDDINNSKEYKECLSKVYAGGIKNFGILIRDYIPKTERFCCPALDSFLDRYGYDLNDESKIEIYLSTAYWEEWYQKMINSPIITDKSKIYDPMSDSMCGWVVNENRLNYLQKWSDYELLKTKNIPGFPKTFDTFCRHREKYSDKYKEWMSYK
jgi:hypothetical protein